MADSKYDLDGVSNIMSDFGVAPIPQSGPKGDTALDGIESVETDASLRYEPDMSQRPGPAVELDAVTEVDGMAKQTDYAGGNGKVESWPRAWGGRR